MKVYRKNDALVISLKHHHDWKQDFLLISDVHYDSKLCDRKLLKKDLDEAKKRNAKILIFGDFYDVMGGKYDKRTTKEDIRPEYSTSNYFQEISRDAAKYLKPYKNNIILISDGNHEFSIKKNHEFDLLDDLIERLGLDIEINRGKYNGFIRFKFEKLNGGSRSSKTMYYTHGGGGNAPVTKGTIKTNRRQESIHADFFVSGHIHTEFSMPRTQARLNEQCNVEIVKCEHYQLGCYKNEFLNGGWADQKEFTPANMGGRWLTFYYRNKKVNYESYRTS